jgi:hypothetical protein
MTVGNRNMFIVVGKTLFLFPMLEATGLKPADLPQLANTMGRNCIPKMATFFPFSSGASGSQI